MPKVVRDAVHGDIQLDDFEIELIDTPEFQRLRGIRQLGAAHLVFPSAVHTRFEHSLGTAWVARQLLEQVGARRFMSESDQQTVRAAALLHDITHIPFGHTLEDERRILPRHDKDEDRTQFFLRDSRIGALLDRRGIQQGVIATIQGRNGLASDIVGGAVSADLLDYLRRDNYFCGLSQSYDTRVLSTFQSQNDRLIVNLEKNGRLRHDALSEIVNLLRIRYTLSERVYFHHTKIAAGAMISRAVEAALGSGLRPEALRSLKDESLLALLGERFGHLHAVRRITDCLAARSLYKAAVVVGTEYEEATRTTLVSRFHEDAAARTTLEAELSARAGVETEQVIVYCPALGMALPEANVLARSPGGWIAPLSDSNNDEIKVLKDKHRRLWKFYVFLDRQVWDRVELVRQAWREVLQVK